ncbi:hypothetical protein ACQW5G_00220 [Fructilactobacillus sp. Tb1]|uniref:hypothetical protein n=1 Tax=Fructilactobacillus sp. Tb1 TaxID=3422304 RepID=UPI003D2AF4B0
MKVYKINKISLDELRYEFGSFNVPQKYTFLDNPAKKDVLDYLLNQTIIETISNDWNKYYSILKTNS